MSRCLLRIENLEQRRLMDADGMACNVRHGRKLRSRRYGVGLANGSVDDDQSTDSQVTTEPKDQTDISGITANSPISCFAAYPPTQVFRSGSTVVAIAPSDYSGTQKLWCDS